MNKLVTLTAAALTAMSFTAPALAADAGRTVAYGDLDLSSAAGVETFNRRVRAAAQAVCGDAPAVRPVAETMWIRRCVEITAGDHRRQAQPSARATTAA